MKSLAQARIKRDRALQLAAEGHSYEAIADAVGYSHRGSAHRAVFRALDEHEATDVEALRAMEVARLDVMLRALWPQIEDGDLNAIAAAIRISDMRCRITGVYGSRRVQHQQPMALVRSS